MNEVGLVPDLVRVRNVLISVWDKTGIEDLINGLLNYCPDVVFYSTGGTFKVLEKLLGPRASKQLIQVSDYTGQAEMQGGLVKTLDFKIYLGLLSEPYNPDHLKDLEDSKAITFDLTVVNLYPFSEASSKADSTLEISRSHIDIGGPTMLRASAKNFIRLATLGSPEDYSDFLTKIKTQNGCTKLKQRLELSKKIFKKTAQYDAAISKYLDELDIDSKISCYTIKE